MTILQQILIIILTGFAVFGIIYTIIDRLTYIKVISRAEYLMLKEIQAEWEAHTGQAEHAEWYYAQGIHPERTTP